MTLPIDHNVPMPHIRNRELRDTFKRMRKGDSFKAYTQSEVNRAYDTSYRLGMKVTIAKQNGHWRVWLVNKNGKK